MRDELARSSGELVCGAEQTSPCTSIIDEACKLTLPTGSIWGSRSSSVCYHSSLEVSLIRLLLVLIPVEQVPDPLRVEESEQQVLLSSRLTDLT